MKNIRSKLRVLQSLGLGYLRLGEDTPGLSGGEAQRLKLASEMGREQADSVFVFDEQVPPLRWVGCACIVFGVFLSC